MYDVSSERSHAVFHILSLTKGFETSRWTQILQEEEESIGILESEERCDNL